jgi:hypothetical protein
VFGCANAGKVSKALAPATPARQASFLSKFLLLCPFIDISSLVILKNFRLLCTSESKLDKVLVTTKKELNKRIVQLAIEASISNVT